ncbi:MAG: Wzz/FepE/Etk N-terminal domain-containing protein [Beijerinckiaceae bacterium]|nr:Wzz/FepE/Etk N-terminal domain-containing protein [Beijerinckiaceae bacterium]
MPRSLDDASNHALGAGELDLRGLGDVLKRRRRTIIAATLTAFALSFVFVELVSPRYQAESLVLLENQENLFTLPEKPGQTVGPNLPVDAEDVGSQIQLITSRDLAVRAIKDLGLRNSPEFEGSGLGRVMMLFGGSKESAGEAAETHAVKLFEDKLSVFSPPKTRVITIQFQSKSPALAAKVANKMAELYIAEQTDAKQASAKRAAEALNARIVDLRVKVANADAERERYRAENGLLTGANNLTINGQQLADINGELSKARTSQADAQAKASLIRDLLRAGKTADVSDVINNELVRRVADERVTVQANLAFESRTLLPSHPRIQALNAQLAGLDEALRVAAKQAVATLENDAKIAGQRLRNLDAVLAEQKKAAGTSNGDEVRLRSLDRVAQTYKDQLETSMAKYQEALAREMSDATPADARIIARASEPQEPVFPKKVPIVGFATFAAFILTAGVAVAGELLAVSPSPTSAPTPDRPSRHAVPEAADMPVRARRTPTDGFASPALAQATGAPRAAISEPHKEGAHEAEAQERGDPEGSTLARLGRGLRAFGESALDARLRAATSKRQANAGSARDAEPAPMPSPTRQDSVQAREPGDPDKAPGADREVHRDLVERIVADHVPGRGVQIASATIGLDTAPANDMIGLARALSHHGRAIIVDLNASPEELAPLVGAGPDPSVTGLAGLSELLAGEVSFAEVIHRDRATRLHFIPAGMRDADFRDFDLILEALSETYDFIVLLTPAFPASEIVKIMAPHTDFIVLTAAADLPERQLDLLRNELVEAGAKDVLVARQPIPEKRDRRTPGVA